MTSEVAHPLPVVIQGGMGVGISHWKLARTVSALGQLGVVSGTALSQLLARRLQDGDPGGHMRRALDHFPVASMAEEVWNDYFIPGGKPAMQAYRNPPMHDRHDSREVLALSVVANFVEVFLAREGHDNPVGINYLEKIQLPHLPSIYGAMLAGVDYVLMGAGIPAKIPGVLDAFVDHGPATYPLFVTGARPGDDVTLQFDPRELMGVDLPPLKRPAFLAIIASDVLALTLARKSNGRVDGFVVEGPTAGGHNAPPRGKLRLNERGEPVYGERDKVNLEKLRELGLPFWLAGGFGTAERLREARALGAAGVQVGTAFAFCAESGLRPDFRHALLERVRAGTARVFTDPAASPTGFPFKVAELPGTLSDEDEYLRRPRICDLGYLREAYRADDGSVEFRCPSEPVSVYESKGGNVADTVGRKCICNTLIANVGQPQVRAGRHVEVGLVTSGEDLAGRRAGGARGRRALDGRPRNLSRPPAICPRYRSVRASLRPEARASRFGTGCATASCHAGLSSQIRCCHIGRARRRRRPQKRRPGTAANGRAGRVRRSRQPVVAGDDAGGRGCQLLRADVPRDCFRVEASVVLAGR
jgi:nitronate monooxygenase